MPFGPQEVETMSQALSPSVARCYGLARVARAWKMIDRLQTVNLRHLNAVLDLAIRDGVLALVRIAVPNASPPPGRCVFLNKSLTEPSMASKRLVNLESRLSSMPPRSSRAFLTSATRSPRFSIPIVRHSVEMILLPCLCRQQPYPC